MTDCQTETPDNETSERKNRRYAVSTNRGHASHRIRYVETGGAAVDIEDCTFCQSVPDLKGEKSTSGDEG